MVAGLTRGTSSTWAVLMSLPTRWSHMPLLLTTSSQDISKNPTEGDIVLVYDDTPRLTWTLGKVEKLYKGNDGQERSARVRTQARDITRALCDLYPLELTTTEESKPEASHRPPPTMAVLSDVSHLCSLEALPVVFETFCFREVVSHLLPWCHLETSELWHQWLNTRRSVNLWSFVKAVKTATVLSLCPLMKLMLALSKHWTSHVLVFS